MAKTILASLSGRSGDHAVLETAIAAARMDNGHITCLHARIDVVGTAAVAQTAFPRDSWTGDMLVKIGHEEQQRSEHAHAAFLEAMKRHKLPIIDENDIEGPSASWLETRSLLNEPLEEARYHDMTIMGREAQLSQENLKSVLMRSGRPLVIAPGKPPAVFGRRIALAWKESPEAARAVTAAMPFLKRAEQVRIISVPEQPASETRAHFAAERLAAMLRWSGVKSEACIAPLLSQPAEQTLEELVYDWDADLLVMGAYGHSRLREILMGGMTRTMLEDCAIPVFLAH